MPAGVAPDPGLVQDPSRGGMRGDRGRMRYLGTEVLYVPREGARETPAGAALPSHSAPDPRAGQGPLPSHSVPPPAGPCNRGARRGQWFAP